MVDTGIPLTEAQLTRRGHWQTNQVHDLWRVFNDFMRQRRLAGEEWPKGGWLAKDQVSDMHKWAGELLEEWDHERVSPKSEINEGS